MSDTSVNTAQEPCCAHAAAAHESSGARSEANKDRRAVHEHAPPWWMEAAEIGAILVAAGGAHALAGALGHRSYGAWLLMGVGAALVAAALTGRRVLRRLGPY